MITPLVEFRGSALRLLSDERLAKLVAAGDRAAFGVVFARYHQELYRYCLSLLRDREDAADALQGTMLRALRALEGETRAIALRPWLYRIAHNESIDLLRRRPPRSDGAAELDTSLDWGVEAGAEARARLEQLLLDLRELPERQRGALVMRELAGLDYAQIAAALDASPGAAKQAVYEARRTLFELAKGRDLDCDGVRSRLSAGDRRFVRARAVRAHLRECSGCREFDDVTASRRSALSSLLPGLPAGAAAELLGGAGTAGLATSVGLKALAAVALVAVAGAGATRALPHAGPTRPPEAGVSAPAAPERTAQTHVTLARAPSRAIPRHAERKRVGGAPATARRPASSPVPAAGHTHAVTPAEPKPDPVERTTPADPSAPEPSASAQPAPSQPASEPAPPPSSQSDGGGLASQVPHLQDAVDSTVQQVTSALPVRTPPLPHLPHLGR